MSNAEFIKRYGKYEFREMCKHISQDLAIAKVLKQIGGYKINNSKKIVKFFRRDKESITVEFAIIFTLGMEKLKDYIERKP